MAYSLTYSYNSASESYSVTGYSGITTSDKVVIPDTYDDGTNGEHPVTIINDSAFEGCTGLTSVKIGNNVTMIFGRAFEGCSSLTSVTIGNSVTNIAFGAFQDCSSLTSVIIPDKVKVISPNTFSGCSNLIQLVVFPFTPPTLGPTAIPNNVRSIYVRHSCKAAYKAATSWKTFANGRIVSDNIYLSFVLFNQKNKEYINKKISESASSSSVNVVQTTGDSETDVMSQKAVTDNFLKAVYNSAGWWEVSDAVRFTDILTALSGITLGISGKIDDQGIRTQDGSRIDYPYLTSGSYRFLVRPNDLPTETSLVTISSTGTQAYKKVSELVDTTSEQTIEGFKTFSRILVKDETNLTNEARAFIALDGIRYSSSGSYISASLYKFPGEIDGTFALTPSAAPTEPSVVVNAVDRTPTWKPVSELGGNALKVTVW